MRTHWGEPPIGNVARAEGLATFRRYIEPIFAGDASLRSAILSVAQYWADEADDAVHAWVVFSKRDMPVWPHVCNPRRGRVSEPKLRFGDDVCSSCGRYEWCREWDDNGAAIEQFQACCLEGGSQELWRAQCYLPYAVARRTEGGVTVEIIGEPVRLWLDQGPGDLAPTKRDPQTAALLDLVYEAPRDDAPRQVLADHLLEKGDPRGTYLLNGDPALEARYGPAWLGPLAGVASPESVVMERGFPRAVAVHTPGYHESLWLAPEWGTVEDVWYLPQSAVFLAPTMCSLRSVGPVDREGLKELAAHARDLPLEDLHVILDHDGLAELARIELPRLRRLAVALTGGGLAAPAIDSEARRGDVALPPELLAPLEGARFWSSLEELVLMSTSPAVVHAWTHRPVTARPPRLTFAAPSPVERPAGFTLSLLGRDATVRMDALGFEPSIEEVARMIDALPDRVDTVRLEPTRWFTPTDADRAVLTGALSRPRTVV